MNQTQNLESMMAATPQRIMFTHLPYYFLGKELSQKKCKVIVVMRNPKDVVVSYYHFYRANLFLGHYTGSFEGFLEIYQNEMLNGGDWFFEP